ncbi:MAG: ABC transporter ATP-binding protein [Bacteroidales bacterium]|nr:ABC transporter ATP-binding protein [Bacteroidales bacterium]
MIQLSHIDKSFGSLKVLKDVSLEFESSKVITIVGPSGAGKSTLLHLIGTLDRPDRGDIVIDGVKVNDLNDDALSDFRGKHIGFVFQFHHLLPEFSAMENVMLPMLIAGKTKTEAKSRAQELLSFLKLDARVGHKPSELSGGEQQRMAVARALANNPDLILADEPSGNLDTENAKNLHQLFFDLRDQFHQTFVIVTHNDELARLSDRRVVMRDGEIISAE